MNYIYLSKAVSNVEGIMEIHHHHLAVLLAVTDWVGSGTEYNLRLSAYKTLTIYKGENGDFTVRRPGRHQPGQVIRVHGVG